MEPAKGDEHDATVVARAAADGWQSVAIDPFGNRIELIVVASS